jgi:hypothetical protein
MKCINGEYMKKTYLFVLLVVGLIFFVACSSHKLPQGSYRVGFDNMEPDIMKNAIVKVEEISNPSLIEIGDMVLLNW